MMIDYPRNFEGLLQNIRALYEGGLLESEETYTEEKLLRFSGGQEIEWKLNIPGEKDGWIGGFRHLISDLHAKNGYVFAGMGISVAFSNSGRPDFLKMIISFTKASGVSFEEIERVFGLNWQMDNVAIMNRLESIGFGRIFYSPTHRMGNSAIIYKLHQGLSERRIEITLRANGDLETLLLSAERVSKQLRIG
jgi:hypothetical protein